MKHDESHKKIKDKIMNTKLLQPETFNDIVFENDVFCVKKICFWPKCSVWQDSETGLLKVNLPGSQAFNVDCIATYAYPDGRRAIEQDFCYLGSFHEGLAKVAVAENKYGFLNKEMVFVIPPIYNHVREFKNGFSIVYRLDENEETGGTFFIDKQGNEFSFEKIDDYDVISDFSDGMFMVSALKNCGIDETQFHLKYFCDHYSPGYWGYADNTGKEVITPQYIYAEDFENGYARVCRGKWIQDEAGKYFSEKELWGMIDKTGKEVVPCIFDEIKYFSSDTENRDLRYLQAHYGGWENGKWGIINYSGEWVVEPMFVDLYYDISVDDCIEFANEDGWNDPDEGIYSIREKRVLFEPQFKWVDFLTDGTFKVEKYDPELDRNIEQIIDKNGKTMFDSVYSSLYIWSSKDVYETVIREKCGRQLRGLIDKKGNEILPCKFETSWNGLLVELQKIIFKKDGKYGVMTFDEKIIIEPKYTSISNIGNEFFKIKVGGEEHKIDEGKVGLVTLDGVSILPIIYSRISIYSDTIIAKNDEGSTIFKITRK